MHFCKKPVKVISATCYSEKAEDHQKEMSDFIKFSETVKSDLMKFSDGEVKVEDLPQRISNVLISGNGVAEEKTEAVSTKFMQLP